MAFYGWPYSYFGQIVDDRVKPPRPDLVAKAIKPDYALGPHTASLGLALADGAKLPAAIPSAACSSASTARGTVKPLCGYRVIFVPFSGGMPSGPPIDVLTGFVDDAGNAKGRPVGVVVDKQGGVLVADDVGNVIWRVSARDAERRASNNE